MIHVVWVILIGGSFLLSVWKGDLAGFQKAVFEGSTQAVQLCIGLAGTLAFWLGLLKVAEHAGFLQGFAKLCSPMLRMIFPGIPKGHESLGWMAANVAANLLGMGSAATPAGIRAMQSLKQLHQSKTDAVANRLANASPEMITFVILNTAGVTLIPATVIAMRVHLGSAQPDWIIAPSILATGSALIFALAADRILRSRND